MNFNIVSLLWILDKEFYVLIGYILSEWLKNYLVMEKNSIINPHLDLEVETSGDSRFSVFQSSKSKFTGKNIDFSIEILLDPRVNLLLEPRKTEKRLSQPVSTSRSRCGSIIL